MVREKPDCLPEVRNEALLWEMEDSRSHRCKAVKHNQVQFEAVEAQCSVTTTDYDQYAALGDVQRAVAHQEKQLAELVKTLAELSTTVKEMCKSSTQQTFQEPKPGVDHSVSSRQRANLSASSTRA